jgi:hypothetical protein
MEKIYFGIEARRLLIAPVRLFRDQLTVPVITEFTIMEWKNKEGVALGSLVVYEDLRVWISQCDLYRPSHRLPVCSMGISFGIVIHILAVTMDDENE